MTTNEVLAIALKALKNGGGGGGGGTSNYNNLTNLPKINGITLQGNKTSADLGINSISDIVADTFDDTQAYAVGDIVVHDDKLYQFIEPHAVGNWDNDEVTETSISALIRSIQHALAEDFDATSDYSVGDLVLYEGILYQFTSAYTANNGWDSNIVQTITIENLIIAYVREAKASVEGLVGDQFSTSENYAIGDKVMYEDVLYRFTSAHTAGAWNVAEVEIVNVVGLIDEIKPLTTTQLNTLLGNLD